MDKNIRTKMKRSIWDIGYAITAGMIKMYQEARHVQTDILYATRAAIIIYNVHYVDILFVSYFWSDRINNGIGLFDTPLDLRQAQDSGRSETVEKIKIKGVRVFRIRHKADEECIEDTGRNEGKIFSLPWYYGAIKVNYRRTYD